MTVSLGIYRFERPKQPAGCAGDRGSLTSLSYGPALGWLDCIVEVSTFESIPDSSAKDHDLRKL